MMKNTSIWLKAVLITLILAVLGNADNINIKKETIQDQMKLKQPLKDNTTKQQKSFLADKMNEKLIQLKNDNKNSRISTKDSQLLSVLKSHQNQKIKLYVKQVMQNNRNKINQHNSKADHSYKMKENRFIIYTTQEFNAMFLKLNIPNDKYIKNKHLKTSNIKSQQQLPVKANKTRLLQQVTVDWKFVSKMTSVKYQRQCGSCYSFSVISVIQSAYILFKNKYVNLAEQQLIDCSAPYGNLGCDGGWTTNAFQYIKDFGIVYEAEYPYIGKANECKIDQNKMKFGIKDFFEIENDCNMVMQALKKQPLSIAINADGWQYYSNGVYTDCRQGPSNHGVVLAGVDSTSWLIKNSWGYSWGEQGYIRISRTTPNNSCNVCQWASYPVL